MSSGADQQSVQAGDRLAQRMAVIAAEARQTNLRRVGELDAAVDRWAELDQAGRTSAIGVAHALAGSAGTFGYQAVSVTARELQSALADGAADRAPELVTRLRDGLDAEPDL